MPFKPVACLRCSCSCCTPPSSGSPQLFFFRVGSLRLSLRRCRVYCFCRFLARECMHGSNARKSAQNHKAKMQRSRAAAHALSKSRYPHPPPLHRRLHVDEGPTKGQLPEAKGRKQGRVTALRPHKARASSLQHPTARRSIVQQRNGRACLSSWDATNSLNSNSTAAQGHPPPLAVHARRYTRPPPHLDPISLLSLFFPRSYLTLIFV